MSKRSGSEQRSLDRTFTLRWDQPSYDKLVQLAEANGKSAAGMVRWLAIRAHNNLPRTKELSRELIRLRIAINMLATVLDASDGSMAQDLREIMRELDRALRKIR